jgi:tetratricopeptide (TPR) repeat protein
MIELLLVADRLLAAGDLDRSERIFRQVTDADPRNAIAVVGLARVAEARGERDAAKELAERALAIDPEDQAARHLAEVLAAPPAPVTPDRPAARRSILDRLRALLGRS